VTVAEDPLLRSSYEERESLVSGRTLIMEIRVYESDRSHFSAALNWPSLTASYGAEDFSKTEACLPRVVAGVTMAGKRRNDAKAHIPSQRRDLK
jgi:hypothetical protein